MLAWTPPEIAAAGIPIVPRTAECTISRSLADTQVFSARGRAMASAAGVEEGLRSISAEAGRSGT